MTKKELKNILRRDDSSLHIMKQDLFVKHYAPAKGLVLDSFGKTGKCQVFTLSFGQTDRKKDISKTKCPRSSNAGGIKILE